MGAVEVNGYTIEPGADLTRANLSGADLRRANLSGADLRRADLSGANLEEADLDRATADKYTLWPEGFDPVAAGVTFEGSHGGDTP